jgi:hypothetical protein
MAARPSGRARRRTARELDTALEPRNGRDWDKAADVVPLGDEAKSWQDTE